MELLREPHNDFVISTLNAFGFRILRDHFPAEGKEIVESARVWRLVKEVKEELASTPHDALPRNNRGAHPCASLFAAQPDSDRIQSAFTKSADSQNHA